MFISCQKLIECESVGSSGRTRCLRPFVLGTSPGPGPVSVPAPPDDPVSPAGAPPEPELFVAICGHVHELSISGGTRPMPGSSWRRSPLGPSARVPHAGASARLSSEEPSLESRLRQVLVLAGSALST